MGALCCSGEKGVETQGAGRAEGCGHYEQQLIPAESNYLNYFSGLRGLGPLPPGVSGLVNLGNTCFINSALQCLTALPSITDYFLSGSYKFDRSPSRTGLLASLFAGLLLQRWKEGVQTSRPSELVSYVWRHSHFSPRSQNDSQEFLAYFLDQLHEELNRASAKSTSPLLPHSGDEEAAADFAWQQHLQRNRSIIVEKFQGQLKSSLTCLRCKHTSVTFEPFMFLSVPIPAGRPDSLRECLAEFTKSERLGGSECWTCPHCLEPVEALKKLELWKVPPVLIIHLKRFYCEREAMGKLNKSISYPLSNLMLDQFTGKPQIRLPGYNLIAKINHIGSITSGHYTAQTRLNGVWLDCDDDHCTIIDSSSLQSASTYVLLYTAGKDCWSDTSMSISSIATLAE